MKSSTRRRTQEKSMFTERLLRRKLNVVVPEAGHADCAKVVRWVTALLRQYTARLDRLIKLWPRLEAPVHEDVGVAVRKGAVLDQDDRRHANVRRTPRSMAQAKVRADAPSQKRKRTRTRR